MVSVSAASSDGATVGSYSFTYTVVDPEPLTSNVGTVTVNVTPTGTPPSTSTTTTTTTTTLVPAPACTFVVTSAVGGNSGIGVLEVSNSGGAFTGWQIRLTQKSSSKPWSFTWGGGVLASSTPGFENVSGTQTITQTTPFTVSAGLNQPQPGNPKIVVNDTLTCLVVAP